MTFSLRRGLTAAALVATALVPLASCGASDGGSPASSTISGVATPAPESSAQIKADNAEATAEARQQAVDNAAGKKAADAIARKAAEQTTDNNRMLVILTAYCNIPEDTSSIQDAENAYLERVVWPKFWRAGKWDMSLLDASGQQGACPSLHAPAVLPTTG